MYMELFFNSFLAVIILVFTCPQYFPDEYRWFFFPKQTSTLNESIATLTLTRQLLRINEWKCKLMNVLFLSPAILKSDHSLMFTWQWKTSGDPIRLVADALWTFLASLLKDKGTIVHLLSVSVQYMYLLRTHYLFILYNIFISITRVYTAIVHTFSVMWLNFHHAPLVR